MTDRMHTKRTLGIILCLVMAAGLVLTACRSDAVTGTAETVQEPAASDDAAETDASATDDTAADSQESEASSPDTETGEEEQTQDGPEGAMEMIQLSDGIVIPELSLPKLNVPESEASEFLRNMGVGFNLGNTFDAYIDPLPGSEMDAETCWGNPVTTEQMIKDIHAYGFDTIRIPVSWHNHVDADYNISAEWLDRVNEVVDWAYNDGMYVIINIHHDNHEEAHGLYPDRDHLDQSNRYVAHIWEQLSERFADYDEHLIFEAMNEPRLVGTDHEWYVDSDGECREAIDCINLLNQLFVDTVRASGGNNATRYLMCPGYDASVDGGTSPFFELPTDIEGNESKIILSIHAYTPYNFALEYPGVKDFDVDNKDRTADINTFMNKLYMDYVTQGVPVVIGEFGSRDKGGNLQDRVNFAAYFTAMSRARNIPCIVWDNGLFSGDGELFGIYDRRNPENSNTDIITALVQYK